MKKAYLLVLACMITSMATHSQNIGIGTNTPNANAILDKQSSDKGLLLPRMTLSQRNNIPSPATGLLIYQTDNTPGFYYFNSSVWVLLSTAITGYWAQNGSDIYNSNNGDVGIGTNTPAYDLHISRPSPSIGFSEANGNQLSGIISGSNTDLLINSYRMPLGGATPAGNLILQVGRGLPQPLYAGNVGIGTAAPDTKLQIENGTNISATAGGYLQIGASASANIAVDANQFQARNNGAASTMYMQTTGGDLQIGGASAVIVNDGYQVYRNRPLSSYADLLPIAYAKIDGFSASALSGTGNISVAKTDVGDYRLTILGENNFYANRNLYSILLTVNYTAVPVFASAEIQSDNKIHVTLVKPNVNWVNETCGSCPTTSYISNAQFWQYRDAPFTIVIYKQ